MMTTTEEKLYSIAEVATRFGLAEATIRQYGSTGKIKSEKDENGRILGFRQEAIDAYAQTRVPFENGTPSQVSSDEVPLQTPVELAPPIMPVMPVTLSVKQPEPPKKDDTQLLQHILSSVCAFLVSHGLPVGIQAFYETKGELRLWEVQTPECSLRVIAEGERVMVLSDSYQKYLEETIQQLRQRLEEQTGRG